MSQKDSGKQATAKTMVTKHICQHSRDLPAETMNFLRGIAADYAKVKNAVYERYAGIRNLNRLTPVYTVQQEMRACGLRKQLNLPVVYYELAVTEAVGNIKAMWEQVKDRIREVIRDKDTLSTDERMYVRTVLKLESILAAVLNRRPYTMPRNMMGKAIDTKRMNNLICRLVRRYLTRPHIHSNTQFKVSPAGYRYQDGGIYLVSRIPRSRIYLPLKGNQTSSRQIRVKLAANRVQIHIPVDIEAGDSDEGVNDIYIYIGYRDALTLSNGNIYGKNLAKLVTPETERLNTKNTARNRLYVLWEKNVVAGHNDEARRILVNNLGKKKYDAQRVRRREQTQNYINAEINRMIAEEKPRRVVITKAATKRSGKSYAKAQNRRYARSFSGYIRKRLEEKCRVKGIEFIAISSKDTRGVCSQCGAVGICDKDGFHCVACGYQATVAQNSASNIEKKALQAVTKKD